MSEAAAEYLARMQASDVHTVQWMPDAGRERWEVIYAGRPPFDETRSGNLEAIVWATAAGAAQRVERRRLRCCGIRREHGALTTARPCADCPEVSP